MTQLTINGISGCTSPYNIFVCDVYGNQCTLIATISSGATYPISFVLPPLFNSAPALGLKLIDANGIEKFGIVYCAPKGKIFQDGEIFIFMDANIYIFEDQ